MFKDTENGHTNFCLNCELLQRKFDTYKDVKEFEIARYKQCLYEIEEIIIKRQKEHYCYCDECGPFKEILQKIKEVKCDE